MRKPYTLDMSIYRDVDRCAAVENILADLDITPSDRDLEQMADYIICGKDDDDLNLFQKGLAYMGTTRYSSFRKKSDKHVSLDAFTDPSGEPLSIAREPIKYTNPHTRIDHTTDGWIPGMQQLWETIDRLTEQLAAIKPFLGDQSMSYRYYKMRHHLIQTRKDQFFLKDAYLPPIAVHSIAPTGPTQWDWDTDAFYWLTPEQWRRKVDTCYRTIDPDISNWERDGELVKWHIRRHKFNWQDPLHVKALIRLYSDLYPQFWNKPYMDTRLLLLDLERYASLICLPPQWRTVLDETLAGASNPSIQRTLQRLYGCTLSVNYINCIIGERIPQRIAAYATRQHASHVWDGARKKCAQCGRDLPKTNLFFSHNVRYADQLAPICVECAERIAQERRLIQRDRRYKRKNLSKVPPKEADN